MITKCLLGRSEAGLIPLLSSVVCSLLAAEQASDQSPTRFPRSNHVHQMEQRQDRDYQQRSFPLGYAPAGARQRAWEQIQQSKALSPPRPAGGSGGFWFPIGPTPIHDPNFKIRGSDTIGRVSAVAVDPNDGTHWLLGAAQGGIWQSFDSGDNWSAVSDDAPSLAIGAIAFAPNNPDIVYAGTGEANFGAVTYAGVGLLKSTDGGSTWFQVAGAPFLQTAFSAIKVDSSNTNNLVVATAKGVMGRVEHATNTPPSASARGVFVSHNGGTNWMQTLFGEATDVEVVPANFELQYAALGDDAGAPTNGVYRSIDGGMSWARIDGPWSAAGPTNFGRIEMALAPTRTDRLYVTVAETVSGGTAYLMGIWQTDNAWDPSPSWQKIFFGLGGQGAQVFYYQDLLVHPSDPDVLYLGLLNVFRFDGLNWQNLGTPHDDQHALAWAPTFDPSIQRLLAGNDGGLSSRFDNFGGWINHLGNSGRLAITQFYRGAVHPEDSSVILGGSQDNGSEVYDGNPSSEWTAVDGGDGYCCMIATNPPNKKYWAVMSQYGDISRTEDGQNFIGGSAGIDSGFDFFMEFIKHPVNHDICLAGSFKLWRCEKFWSSTTPSWTPNSPALTTVDGSDAFITAIAFAPTNVAGRIYAYGTMDGQLRLTTDAGMNWTDIDAGGAVPERYVSGLAFSSSNAQVLYVTLSGFDEGTPGHPGHVFKTSNALAADPTWANVSPSVNLPQDCIAINPLDAQDVFVGSDLGVWHSSNGGGSWAHQGPRLGMPNVAVYDLQFDNLGHLTAFTYGRGAFKYSMLPIFLVPSCALQPCWPLFINPEDLVTISLPLWNELPIPTVDVTAQMRPTAQILPVGGVQIQSYGALSPQMGTVTRQFQFQAMLGAGAAGGAGPADTGGGGCGSTVYVTFDLADGGQPRGSVSIPFRLGTLRQPLKEDFEQVTLPALPSGWTSTAGLLTPPSTTSNIPPNVVVEGDPDELDAPQGLRGPVSISAFFPDPTNVSDASLYSPPIPIWTDQAQLSFRHSFDLPPSFDGAVLEIAIGAQGFTDIIQAGGSFSLNGYNATLVAGIGPLGGRTAWSGNAGGWLITEVNLPATAAQQAVQFRWRMAGAGAGGNGWFIDDVAVSEYFCRPKLSVFSTTTNAVVVAWPAPSTGWTLQQNSNLVAGAWADSTDTITNVVGQNEIIISPPIGNRFYRLLHP